MPSLISSNEKQVLTGIFGDIFDTFCRNIVVIKEPRRIKISNCDDSKNIFGFGESQNQAQYNYEPYSGVFPALIHYGDVQKEKLTPELQSHIFFGPVSIKVRKEARDFINNGQTDKFMVDTRTFILNSNERKQTFLGSEYYVYELKEVR